MIRRGGGRGRGLARGREIPHQGIRAGEFGDGNVGFLPGFRPADGAEQRGRHAAGGGDPLQAEPGIAAEIINRPRAGRASAAQQDPSAAQPAVQRFPLFPVQRRRIDVVDDNHPETVHQPRIFREGFRRQGHGLPQFEAAQRVVLPVDRQVVQVLRAGAEHADQHRRRIGQPLRLRVHRAEYFPVLRDFSRKDILTRVDRRRQDKLPLRPRRQGDRRLKAVIGLVADPGVYAQSSLKILSAVPDHDPDRDRLAVGDHAVVADIHRHLQRRMIHFRMHRRRGRRCQHAKSQHQGQRS